MDNQKIPLVNNLLSKGQSLIPTIDAKTLQNINQTLDMLNIKSINNSNIIINIYNDFFLSFI